MEAAKTFKSYWKNLTASAPGERFEAVYERRQKARNGVWRWGVSVGLGFGLVAVGIVLLFLPGPGLLFLALGLANISSESRLMARGLDVAEVKMRAAWQVWERLRPRQKVLFLAFGTLVLLGLAGWVYSLM